MPRFPLSVSPTFDHSSELIVIRENYFFFLCFYNHCIDTFQTSCYVESCPRFLPFLLSFIPFPQVCHNLNSSRESSSSQKHFPTYSFASNATHARATYGSKTVEGSGRSRWISFKLPHAFLHSSTTLAWFSCRRGAQVANSAYFVVTQRLWLRPPDALSPPPVPHLSLQAPFHSVLPQGFLMRIRGMVSFRK